MMLIDTHTHFYDPRRPQGVPWPPPNDSLLYRPVLPAEYVAQAEGLQVHGTIAIECSRPFADDNDWMFTLAAQNPIILGFIAYLDPAEEHFARQLDRCLEQPIFRGFRLHSRDIPLLLGSPNSVAALKRLADHHGIVEIICSRETYANTLDLSAALPKLTVLIEHLGRCFFEPPDGHVWSTLRRLSPYQNVVGKVSGLLEDRPFDASTEPVYRASMDRTFELFGAHRLVFGSNWPVIERHATLNYNVNFARTLLGVAGRSATEAVLLANPKRLYRVSTPRLLEGSREQLPGTPHHPRA